MVKTIFGKKGKSLVFPVTSQGYVGLKYSDYFSTENDDSEPFGIYGLKDESFTLEAFLTPYDTIGNGNHLRFASGISASSTEAQKNALSNNETEKVYPTMSRLLVEDSGRTSKHYLAEVERKTLTQLNTNPINMDALVENGRVMTIFHNKYVNLSLVNNGVSDIGRIYPSLLHYDLYNPASYRLRASVYAGGGYDTLVSDFIFNPVTSPMNSWSSQTVGSPATTHAADEERIYFADSKKVQLEPLYYAETKYGPIGDKIQLEIKRSTANTALLFEIRDRSPAPQGLDSDAKTNLVVGMELYTEHGIKIGKIVSVGDLGGWSDSAFQFWVDDGDTKDYTDDWSSGWEKVYIVPQKEAVYMFNTHMVALSFNYESGRMNLFYNGHSVASKQHNFHPESGTSDAVSINDWSFSFSQTDCYIGKNVEHDTWDIPTYPENDSDYLMERTTGLSPLRTQFFGEFHELAISKGFKKTFSSVQNFEGKYDNLLLYYQFDGGKS